MAYSPSYQARDSKKTESGIARIEHWELEIGDHKDRGVGYGVETPSPFVSSGFSSAAGPSRPEPLKDAPLRRDGRRIPLKDSWEMWETPAENGPFKDPEDATTVVGDNASVISDGSFHPPGPPPGPPPPGFFERTWKKNQDFINILLCNFPFFIAFLMETIGTYIIPTSEYYRTVVHRPPFQCAYIVLGVITASINTLWFFGTIFNNVARREDALRRYKARGRADRMLTVIKDVLLIFLAIAGVCLWPLIEVFGAHKRIMPTYPSCEALGFESNMLLQVVGSAGAGFFGNPWLSNNVTISSGEWKFGLTLSPTIRPGRDFDVFYFNPSKKLTTPELFDQVVDNRVTVNMTDKTYQFGHNYTVQQGKFSDERDYYLSFPDLTPPMHSATKGNWTYVGSRPWVEMVDGRKNVLLKTTRNQPGDRPDTMMRMCGEWGLSEMIGDTAKMEGVMVMLARVMIEMARWGLDH